jgi:hypothetical protein
VILPILSYKFTFHTTKAGRSWSLLSGLIVLRL